MRIKRLVSSCVMGLAFASSAAVFAGDVKVNFLESGVTAKVGGYRPVRAEMDQEASIVKKLPQDFAAPKYGYFVFGDSKYAFVVDEAEDGTQRLAVDSNRDGDLTDDGEVTWKKQPTGMHSGEAKIDLGDGKLGKIMMYRFDPEDKRREQLKNTVLYYSDFGFEYAFQLDGKDFSTFVSGMLTEEARLPIDRDGNGRVSQRFEMAQIGKPFNFTGTTYVLGFSKGSLDLREADTKLPQMPLPPDLRLGKKALTFSAKTIEGSEVEFPKSFAGKLVMLDCWATWCGPCIAEIPNMKQAYADWHDKGFEILGVSFDSEGQEDKVKEFLTDKELPWPQIYEGKGWDTSIGVQHDVSGIPFVLLIDGDTGEIIGTSRELRGEKLTAFIGEQLERKASK